MSFHPQTPQSPSQPSPATHLDSMSSVHSVSTGPTTLPTPAHSVSGSMTQSDVAMTDESPNKRKRELDDAEERERQLERKRRQFDFRLGIEDLHHDVGPKYLLCSTRKEPLCCMYPCISV